MIAYESRQELDWALQLEVSRDLLRLKLLGPSPANLETAWKEISLESLRRSLYFRDGSIWSILAERLDRPPEPYLLRDPICYSGETLQSRIEYKRWLQIAGYPAPLTLFLPSFESDFLSGGIKLIQRPGEAPLCNLPCHEMTTEHLRQEVFPELTIEGPHSVGADTLETFTVHATKGSDTKPFALPLNLYLSATGGYLPYRQFVLNSTASFTFRALNLQPGDEVRLQVGLNPHQIAKEHNLIIK